MSENGAKSDDGSLAVLYREHHRHVFAAAYRMTGTVAEAEDILQTVYLNVLKSDRLNTGLLQADPRRYLCRAAINAGLDVLRARKRANLVDVGVETVSDGSALRGTTATDEIETLEARVRLREALTRIDGRAAEIVALRYFEGYGNNEIAELLDSTPASIAVTLHRTRERLKRELADDEGNGHD